MASTRTRGTPRIDAHLHYWKLSWSPYPWMQGLDAIRRDYGPGDLARDLEAAGIDGTVLVQADATVQETDRLLEVAQQTRTVLGVVGWVDLSASNAVSEVERRAAQPPLRGLRPMLEIIAESDWILQPSLKPGLQAMVAAGLCFDALVQPRHLKHIATLIDRHPDLPIVIDHGGKPDLTVEARGTSALRDWRDGMRMLAAHPHVHCKLSGLLTQASPGWTTADILPAAEALLELFGPQRLIWGSDWPVMTLNGTYRRWVEISERLLQGLAPDDRAAVWGGNAVRFYGLSKNKAP